MQFLSVSVITKYSQFAAFSKDLLGICIQRFVLLLHSVDEAWAFLLATKSASVFSVYHLYFRLVN